MTDNQFMELFNLVTKCVNGIQRLEGDMKIVKTDIAELKTDVSVLKTDVAELKADVAELKTDVAELKTDVAGLKEGQKRLEKEMVLVHKALDILSVDSVRTKARIDVLEEKEFTN